jgi:hypothetical protein
MTSEEHDDDIIANYETGAPFEGHVTIRGPALDRTLSVVSGWVQDGQPRSRIDSAASFDEAHAIANRLVVNFFLGNVPKAA